MIVGGRRLRTERWNRVDVSWLEDPTVVARYWSWRQLLWSSVEHRLELYHQTHIQSVIKKARRYSCLPRQFPWCFYGLTDDFETNLPTDKITGYYLQWRQQLGNFGGMDWRKGEGIWGTEVTQWGPGAKTQRGSSGRTPKVDSYLGNWCKTDILRTKNRKCIHWHTVDRPYWGGGYGMVI